MGDCILLYGFRSRPNHCEKVKEIVSANKFSRYFREFNFDTFRMIEGCFGVEVFDVKAGEFRARAREDAIDVDLEGFN